jgi:hypothetical protein
MKKIYIRQSKTNKMNQPKQMTIDYKNGFIEMCEAMEYECGSVTEIELPIASYSMQSVYGYDDRYSK